MFLGRKVGNVGPFLMLFRNNVNLATLTHCACLKYKFYAYNSAEKKAITWSSPTHQANRTRQFCDSKLHRDSEISSIISETEDIIEADIDQDRIRIQLYPEDDTDSYITKLYEATTIQQVFDLVEEIDKNEVLTTKHCSQAVVTLWDLQKLMVKIGSLFDPSSDFSSREQFIQDINSHVTFREKVVPSLMEKCNELEDEPLAASLFCLKRLQFGARSPESEKLLDECIKRKDTLTLPAISRVCVSMRTERLYGSFIQSNFMTTLLNRCQSMQTDIDVRLVSISYRSAQRLLSQQMVQAFREKVSVLSETVNFDTVTLCKIMLVLADTKGIGDDPAELMRKIGNLLAKKVPTMALLDLLILQKLVENGTHEPFPLLDAILKKIARLIEEDQTLRLDLLTYLTPFMKNVYQRQKLASIVSEYIETYKDFETIVHVIYKALRAVRFSDRKLYDAFWNKVVNLIRFETNDVRKVIRFAMDYLNFVHGLRAYRYGQFENMMTKLLYFYLNNYLCSSQPTVISPSDFSRSFSFILAFSSPSDLIFQNMLFIEKLDDFSKQLRITDLHLLGRSIDISLQSLSATKNVSSKYYDIILQICSILERQISWRLLQQEEVLSTLDLISIARTHTFIKRATGDAPYFREAVSIVGKRGVYDSRMAKDLANCLLTSGGYNDPNICARIAEFIERRHEDIRPEVAEKFVNLAFGLGEEFEKYSNVFRICANLIHRHLDKLGPLSIVQSCLSLCYYRSLPSELIHEIFSVDFIDQVDKDLLLSLNTGSNQMKMRHAFMELNRAVCLDMPDANVPWFHKKFCEDVISVATTKENFIHGEVEQLLGEILNDPQAVQKNAYSSYYYLLDFLIEFDGDNRPIIKKPKKKSGLFGFPKSARTVSEIAVQDKVAILILPSKAFTRNVRTLRGHQLLKQRHLEILGYRIVQIDPQKWNSMSMSEPSAKSNFLENHIFKQTNYDNVKVNKS